MGGRGSTGNRATAGMAGPDTTASTQYRGRTIDRNFYGRGEYTVQYQGDDVMFRTLREAREFIDGIDRTDAAAGRTRTPVPASSVSVDTYKFESAHGRKPRGGGSGTEWAFSTSRGYTPISELHWETGTYSQATKKAKRWAGENGYTRLYVES